MAKVWDLSNKKWLYWTGVIGFILTFQIYLWLVAVILYFAYDKGKPKTQNYQIKRIYEKYMIIVGNIGIIIVPVLILIGVLAYFGALPR